MGRRKAAKLCDGVPVAILLMFFLKAIQNIKKLTPNLLLEGPPKRWCDLGFL